MNDEVEYDDDATIANVRRELRGYRGLMIEYRRLKLVSLSAQAYDGVSGGTDNVNHEEEKMMKRLRKQEKVQMAMTLIKKSIELMGEIDDKSARLAAILEFRYIKCYGITKSCYRYAERFDLDEIPRQTFTDHERVAMLLFAQLYPHELRVKAQPA